MRALVAYLLCAVPAAADGPPVVVYAAPARPPGAPPAGVVVKVTEYLWIDGRKVVIAEWTASVARAAVPAPAACPKCGPACQCGPACGCGADYWLATCSAAPKVMATGPPPPPLILPAGPTYPAPVYHPPPVYYAPMPARAPRVGAAACVGGR